MDNNRRTTRQGQTPTNRPGLPLFRGIHPPLAKADWVTLYTNRVLKAWRRQAAPLGLTSTYADHIRKTLSGFYADPLKRTFIEQTYPYHPSASDPENL